MERDKQKLPDEVIRTWRESETHRFAEAARLIEIAENTPNSFILLSCNGDILGLYSSHDWAEKASQSHEEKCHTLGNTRKRFYRNTEIEIDKWPSLINIRPRTAEIEILEKEENNGK